MLDSADYTSFSGDEYNASYFIDLSRVIRNKEDYDKSYYMYCTFISTTENLLIQRFHNLYHQPYYMH